MKAKLFILFFIAYLPFLGQKKDTLLTEKNNVTSIDREISQSQKQIYIKGRVFETQKNRTETNFLGAYVNVKGTKIHSIVNKDGYYNLDITNIKDTAKAVVLQCGFIGYVTQEKEIKGKIIQDTFINFDLKPSPGIEHKEPIQKKSKK